MNICPPTLYVKLFLSRTRFHPHFLQPSGPNPGEIACSSPCINKQARGMNTTAQKAREEHQIKAASMAAYTASNGRFGSLNGRDRARLRLQSWTTTDDSDGFTSYEARSDHVCRPVIIGSDGKATAAVFDCPPGHQHHHHGGVVSGVGGNDRWEQSGDTYRVDQYKAQGYVSSVQTVADGRVGLPGGKFQREKVADLYSDDDTNYWSRRPSVESQVAVSNSGGWARDGRTAGWGAPPPPVGALGRVTNDIGAATEFIREPRFPAAQATDRWSSQAPASLYQPTTRESGFPTAKATDRWSPQAPASMYQPTTAESGFPAAKATDRWSLQARESGFPAAKATDRWSPQAPASMYQPTTGESGFPAAHSTDRWSSQAPASLYQPSVTKKSAGNVIDSKEAAKKYGGQFIW